MRPVSVPPCGTVGLTRLPCKGECEGSEAMRGSRRGFGVALAAGCLLAAACASWGSHTMPGDGVPVWYSSQVRTGAALLLTGEPVRTGNLGTASAGALLGDEPVACPWAEIEFSRNPALTGPPNHPRFQGPVVLNAPQARLENVTLDPLPESLSDITTNKSGNPLEDFSNLAVMPTAFMVERSGRPPAGVARWQQTTQTALSYVRPHRNLQLIVNMHAAGGADDQLSGQLVETEVQLVDDLSVQADSRNVGVTASASYGWREAARSSDKTTPGRMLAFGLDLGLLPAVLGDVGMSVTVAVGETSNPGPFISVATNLELPSERPREELLESLYQPVTDVMSSNPAWSQIGFNSGFAGDSSDVPFTPEFPEEPIPIIPQAVPEPATMLLLAAGLALVAGRVRRTGVRE